MWEASLGAWARVADGSFLRSDFASMASVGAGLGGAAAAGEELAGLQARATRAALRGVSTAALLNAQQADQRRDTVRGNPTPSLAPAACERTCTHHITHRPRIKLEITLFSLRAAAPQGRHLEALLAASVALKSRDDFVRWLGPYAEHLAAEGCAPPLARRTTGRAFCLRRALSQSRSGAARR